MKRRKNLYKEIYDLKNINEIYNVIRKTMKNKNEVTRFEMNKNSSLLNISKELYNKTYKSSDYRMFFVKEPKYRLIMSQCIKDKIVNHLVSRYILSTLENGLIDQNIATRKNKGGNFGYNLLLKYINKLQLENKDIYALKIDIKKYFYNIDHNILKEKLKSKIKDKEALDIIFKIIDSTNDEYINKKITEIKIKEKLKVNNYKISIKEKNKLLKEIENIPYYEKGKGLPIGNMTSQFMAIFYLSQVDHYIKEELKHEYYIRYMDDLVILDNNKYKLIETYKKVKKMIEKEGLEINKKSKLYTLKHGFSFLGYKFRFRDGKLLIRYNNKTIRRIEKDLNRKKEDDYNLYYKSIRSYQGYFTKSNSNLKNKFLITEECMYDKYYNLKKDNKKCLIFIKSGLFYYTYDEDALIMNYIFNYKMISGRLGFPVKNLELKVSRKLDLLSISFIALDGNEINRNNLEENNYVKYLGEAHDKYEKEINLKRIFTYVEDFIKQDSTNYKKINNFLNGMLKEK